MKVLPLGLKAGFIFLILIFLQQISAAQCACTNCPDTIPTSGGMTNDITLSGATNPTLGQNGQSLKAVHINMLHDAIDEIDLTLIAPDGSSVSLITWGGNLSVGQNITFDICFVACSETAMPDPGFPAEFDSDAGYMMNNTYTGTYYPSTGGGCLEDLTGPVDGTWTLEFYDNVNFDGGILHDWSLEFADNGGLNCQSLCNITTCLADGGDIGGGTNTYCEGDPALNYSFTPSYPGSGPDPASYDYTYVITDNTTGIIEEYMVDPDLTTYAAGEYQICGLSYLISDFSLIPSPDGSYTLSDLQDDISNNIFCADVSIGCEIVTIEAPLPAPEISGPTTVCEGETVTYTIDNYEPNHSYTVVINQGSYGQFIYNGGATATVEWLSGPGEICFQSSNSCGAVETCVNITIEPYALPITISGNDDVCPGDVVTYTITPPPAGSGIYVYTVTGGTILFENATEVEIEWFLNGGNNTLCVDLQGYNCPPQQECININVDDFVLPSDLNSPPELCIDGTGSSFINPDPRINAYIWSGNGIDISSGQGTNAINYSILQGGSVEVCLEVETDCGLVGPVCETITIEDLPTPVIDPFGPSCELSFDLTASITSGNTVAWTQIGGPSGASFSPPDQASTTVSVPSDGLYTIVIEESSDLCTGSDTIEIEIFQSPQITNLTFNCILDEYTVSFDINSGSPPYDVNGSPISGNNFTSSLMPSGNTYTFIVTDANGCTAEIEGIHDCPCVSDAGSMSLGLLEACAANGSLVYASHNNDAVFDGNDIGTFYLHDSPNNSLGNVFDQNSNGVFGFQPGMLYGQVYYISYGVGNDAGGQPDLNDPCFSLSQGQPVIFYDSPLITLLSDTFSCDLEFPMSAELSDDVIQLQWEQISGPGFSTFTNDQSAETYVNVSSAGTYTYQLIASNPACEDTLQFTFLANGRPGASSIQEDCVSLDKYILSFEIEGGQSPYSVNIDGTLSGNTFTSDTLFTDSSYQVTITDANNCSGSFDLGTVACDCISAAGTMSRDSILLCETADSIWVNLTSPGTLDGNDTEGFIIHSGNSNLLVDPVFQTTDTVFAIPDTLKKGRLYYISHIVGNSINGEIDLNDPCMEISPGQPLYIYSLPEFDLGSDQISCDRSMEIQILNAKGGIVRLLSMTDSASVTITLDNNVLTVTSDAATELTLEYQETNGLCLRKDTLSIAFLEEPVFTNISEVCIAQSYYVSFQVQGGASPYLLNGDTLRNTSYTSDTVPSGTVLQYLLSDVNGCLSDTLSFEKDCNCQNDAGTLSSSGIELCEDEALDISSLVLKDTVLGSTDTLIFVLHDGSADSIGTVLYSQAEGSIPFSGILNTDRTYYLTMMVGESLNGTLNYNDACLDQSNSIAVIWKSKSNITLVKNDSACIGDTLRYALGSGASYPVFIHWVSDQGRTMDTRIMDSSQFISFEIAFTQEIWMIDSTSLSCPGEIMANVTLTGVEEQEVSFRSDPQVCNTEEFGAMLNLNDLLEDSTLQGEWTSPDFTITGSRVDFEGAAPGTYLFTFSTMGFVDPCPGNSYQISVEVVECLCPNLELPEEISLCNQNNGIPLNTLVSSTLEGSWSLRNIDQLEQPPVIQNNELVPTNSSPGRYILHFQITDSLPSQCPTEYTIRVRIKEFLSAGRPTSIPLFCKNEITNVDLPSILENEDSGGYWAFDGQTVSSDYTLSQLEPGIYSFHYFQVDSSRICPNDTAEIMLELAPPPTFRTMVKAPLCPDESEGSLVIDIQEDIYGPYTLFLNGEERSDTLFSGLPTGDHEVKVENIKGCSTNEAVSIPGPPSLELELGDDITLNSGDEHTFAFSTNLADSMIQRIEWLRDNEVIARDQYSLNTAFTSNSSISVMIISSEGCRIQDELSVFIRKGDLFIPNVFRPESPNEENRVFGITAHPDVVEIHKFLIYDRWGTLIWEARNVRAGEPAAFWDGWFNGQQALPGVYMYSLEYEDQENRTRYLKGDVTLLP